MSAAGKFVLENQNGEVVRTFAFEADALFVVYRHDTRRIEVLDSVKELEDQEISYDLLKKTSQTSVMRRAITFENGARFRFEKGEIESVAPSINIADDSEEQEKTIYKYTALTQVGTLAFIFIVGLLIEPLFAPKTVEEVVTIVPQEMMKQPEPPKTVKAAEHPVKEIKKIAKHKVVTKVKEVPKTLTAQTHTHRKENATLRTKVQVEKVGALGALGGMKSGSKNSAGFNMNATNDSKSASWTGAGSGGVGGIERAVHGAGLVGGPMGRGSKIEGGGGYGTRGKAGGGRAGYGSMNMGGSSGAYFEPVQEEAMTDGGLDKDQIAAVINRHIGEVIYCYEKGLQTQAGLNGRVEIKWVINGSGAVSTAGVQSSSLHNASVEGCIVSHLRSWRFPHPVGGVNVKVAYPFVLKRLSHG